MVTPPVYPMIAPVGLTTATDTLLLLHTPSAVASLSKAADEAHNVVVPEIGSGAAGNGFTFIAEVTEQLYLLCK